MSTAFYLQRLQLTSAARGQVRAATVTITHDGSLCRNAEGDAEFPREQENPTRISFAQLFFDAFRRYGREIGLPIVVLVLVLVFSISSDVFFTAQNLRNIGVAAAALAAVSFGQTFAVLTAGLDLSVGSTVALVSVVAAYGMRRDGIALGVAEGILAGTFVGLINGLVITRFGVFPFIATLAMLSDAFRFGSESERRNSSVRSAGTLWRFRL